MTKQLKSKRKIIRRGKVRYELLEQVSVSILPISVGGGLHVFEPGDYLIYRKVEGKK